MKGRLLLGLLVFPQLIFAQTFYGDTLWTKDYSSTAAFSCAFSPDGTKLAIAYECMGPMVRVLDVNNGLILWDSETPDLCLYNIQFSSNGQYIAIAEELGHLLVIDITIPDTIYNIDTQSGGLNAVDFSPGGDYIYCGGDDGSIRIYETATGMLHHHIPAAHTDAVLTLDVSATGHYLASGSKDNQVKIWDLQNNYQLHALFTDPMDDIKTVKFTPAEDRLLAGGADDMTYIYRTASGLLDTVLIFHGADVNTIDVSADGSFAVSGSNDQSVAMFNMYNYQHIANFTNLWQTRVYGVAISPQMDRLAAANHIGFVIMYDIHSLLGETTLSSNNLVVYPNPTQDLIYLNGIQEATPFELINLNGQIVKTGITSNSIDLNNLAPGMYLLHVENVFKRIIKQ
jgi:WD40 repeat protein